MPISNHLQSLLEENKNFVVNQVYGTFVFFGLYIIAINCKIKRWFYNQIHRQIYSAEKALICTDNFRVNLPVGTNCNWSVQNSQSEMLPLAYDLCTEIASYPAPVCTDYYRKLEVANIYGQICTDYSM